MKVSNYKVIGNWGISRGLKDDNVQGQHRLGEAASDGEDCEETYGTQEHQFASKNVAELGVDDEKPYSGNFVRSLISSLIYRSKVRGESL